MRLIDITHPLSERTATWPGDTPFSLTETARIARGAAVNLSVIRTSPHVGTHADAPLHYEERGAGMAELPLEPFVGPCLVVALEGRQAITVDDLRQLGLQLGLERLLVRTGSCPDLSRFYPDLTYFEPDAIHYLASLGVKLIGTDAHSVDPSESKDLPAHRACGQTGIFIVENLRLGEVEPGEYELIALPLKLEAADGSPVRAVLRTRT